MKRCSFVIWQMLNKATLHVTYDGKWCYIAFFYTASHSHSHGRAIRKRAWPIRCNLGNQATWGSSYKWFLEWNMPKFCCSVTVLVSVVAFEFFTCTKCGLILLICVSINNKYSEQNTIQRISSNISIYDSCAVKLAWQLPHTIWET